MTAATLDEKHINLLGQYTKMRLLLLSPPLYRILRASHVLNVVKRKILKNSGLVANASLLDLFQHG